MVAIL
jgi:transcriptional regulator with XRE-family HTH domain